jgi:hypothetical protein
MDDDEWDVEKVFQSPLDRLTLVKTRCVKLISTIREEMKNKRHDKEFMKKMLHLADANFTRITNAHGNARFKGVSDRDIHALLGDVPRDAFRVVEELNEIVYK